MTNIKQFKPFLLPNIQPDIDKINYPMLLTKKLDWIRCIIKDGEILSRSLKQIRNKQIRERLSNIVDWGKLNNVILDWEIYAEGMSFQQITHYVMTKDLWDKELPVDIKFYCFDVLSPDFIDELYKDRVKRLDKVKLNNFVFLNPIVCINKEMLNKEFNSALNKWYEWLILRHPNSIYKYWRYTFKSWDAYKIKPYRTYDAQIIDVIQATEVDKDSDRTINELWYSVTSKKKWDRVLINKAACFLVKFNGKDLKVVIALNNDYKREIRENRNKYIGRWIEYKGMEIWAKDLPRHPVFIRYRLDKDD